MDQTHRSRFKVLCEQGVIEASQFMGVDAVGHPVTQPRLNVKLIPAQFPETASRSTPLSTPYRSGEDFFNK